MATRPAGSPSFTRNEIAVVRDLSAEIKLFRVSCPEIAASAAPGQFVVFRANDYAERIPLTIAESDPRSGMVTVVFQAVGASTRKLAMLRAGDVIMDVVGPLGRKSEIERFGTVVCVGGGIGVAPVLPIAGALKKAGNRVISIIGARTKDLLILEEEMAAASDEVIVTTDDGSYGRKGFVTDALTDLIARGEKIARVVAIGPVVMMRAVAGVTRAHSIPTVASLNSVMIDATGMCGCCRVSVAGKTRFACVDGPEFDAHDVDFDELVRRQAMYRREEYRALWHHQCLLAAETESVTKAEHRVPMPKQDHRARATNFTRWPSATPARWRSRRRSRCLQCKKAPCVAGCPVEIDIPGFVRLIAIGDFLGAVRKLKEKNSLPAHLRKSVPTGGAVRSRVRPRRRRASRSPSAGSSASRRTTRLAQGEVRAPAMPARTGRKVAVVGAGPAGLTGRRRAGRARAQRHGLRSAPQAGRRAHLRHPRVPAAQEHRADARSTTS